MTKRRSILLALSLCASLAALPAAVRAQGGEDGEALLAAGAKSIEAGNFNAAMQQVSRAMRSDTLSTAQIARALYLRGLANKNAGKPGQAIADLDSALWLQGLSNKDLAQAYLARGESYQKVGMNDLASADLRRAKEVDPNAKTVVAARSAPAEPEVGAFTTQIETADAKPAPRSRTSSAATRIPGFPNAVDTPSEPAPRRAPPQPEQRQAANEPVPEFRTEVRAEKRKPVPKPEPKPAPATNFRTSILPDESPKAAPEPKAAPAPVKSTIPSKWKTTSASQKTERTDAYGRKKDAFEDDKSRRSTVSGFFSGLWGGEKKEPEAQAAAPQPETQPARQPAASWSQSTKVAAAAPRPARSAPPKASAASAAGSTYRIQLASLRTEEEAQSAWQQLSSSHGNLLAGQEHVIEKTNVGSLGTYYRIQLGPFTDKAESTQLCNSLKSSGVDCFLVAR